MGSLAMDKLPKPMNDYEDNDLMSNWTDEEIDEYLRRYGIGVCDITDTL